MPANNRRMSLASEVSTIEALLAETPEGNVIERMSLKARLREIEAELPSQETCQVCDDLNSEFAVQTNYSTPMKYKETQYGFYYGAAKVERLCSDDKKGWVCIGIETSKMILSVYVTKTGKVRIHDQKNGAEFHLETRTTMDNDDSMQRVQDLLNKWKIELKNRNATTSNELEAGQILQLRKAIDELEAAIG